MANLVIWNEFIHEQEDEVVKSIYPRGIHECIKEFLEPDEGLNISTATLAEDDHGLSEELLEKTDVLIWWGHKAHKLVEDRIVDRVQQRVLEGMGLVVLHSGHHSKIFKRLMGTTANIRWAERGEKERVWVCNPGHPIANGLGEYFEIEMTEMYSEPFQVPSPDETVFISWFEGERSLGPAFVTNVAMEKYFISGQDMKLTLYFTTRMYNSLSITLFIGLAQNRVQVSGLIASPKALIIWSVKSLFNRLKQEDIK